MVLLRMKCEKCGHEVEARWKYCKSCGASIPGKYVKFLNGKIEDDINVEGVWYPGGDYILKLEMLQDEVGEPHFRIAYLIKPEGEKYWHWASKREATADAALFRELIAKGLKEKKWFREIILEALTEAGIR